MVSGGKGAERARLGDRILGLLGVRLVIWLLAAQAFLPGVLLDPAHKIAHYHDEHNVVMHEEAARRTFVDYHELPAWNPWFCGGIVGLSNAPSNVLAPDFLLRLLFGTVPGRKLTVLFFVVLGMEGTFRYARRNKASAIGAAMGAVAFSTSGHFVSLLTWGWVFMFHYALIPWVALSFEEGIRKRWWIVAGGFFMAWLVLGGGTYVAPYTGLVLALLFVNETARAALRLDGDESARWYRPALVLLGMAAIAVGLSAIRLFPLLELLTSHARPVEQKDQTGPISVVSMLALRREHRMWGAGAGDYYVGSYVFLLGLVAAVLADRKAAKFWAVALVFGAFACGEFVEDSPYEWMRKVPVFSQLRFPVRMVTVCALFVALAASRGLTRIEDGVRRLVELAYGRLPARARGQRLGLFVGIVAGVAATYVSAKIAYKAAEDVVEHNEVKQGTLYVMDPPQRYMDEFRQARGNRWDAHVWPYASRGSLHCFEEHELFVSPYLRGDLPQEEYGGPETDTQVERISWSPHRIVLRVKSSGPGRVIVNQNHSEHWKSDVGEVGSDGGLLRVKVPPGEHVVTLTYSDWHVRLGALVTFATVLGIAIAASKRARRRGQAFARWFRALPAFAPPVPAESAAGPTEPAPPTAAAQTGGEATSPDRDDHEQDAPATDERERPGDEDGPPRGDT